MDKRVSDNSWNRYCDHRKLRLGNLAFCMTARDIQRKIISKRYAQSFTLQNYTPAKWFECDVFEITRTGYFVEYEIKISRGDFKADASKVKERSKVVFESGRAQWQTFKDKTKHQQLVERSEHGPSRFYFVVPVPALLLYPDEIPEWAGVIYLDTTEAKTWRNMRWIIHKKAPLLHRNKVSESIETHARGVCYWRMSKLFLAANS